jgi:hypothetical protein
MGYRMLRPVESSTTFQTSSQVASSLNSFPLTTHAASTSIPFQSDDGNYETIDPGMEFSQCIDVLHAEIQSLDI